MDLPYISFDLIEITLNIVHKSCQIKKPCSCPICYCSSIINLGQLLKCVHGIDGQERRQIQKEMVKSEVNVTDPQLNHAKSQIVLHMLQHGECLRIELLKNATQGELLYSFEMAYKRRGTSGKSKCSKKKSSPFMVSLNL